jgi:Tol biopolymer transport system component
MSALAKGARLGPYEISAAIGAGGMGEVYRATDTRLGREVALKLLPQAFASDPERLARFDREARLLASLNHSNIAHLYGFETATLDDGTTVHVIAMELAEGEDLEDRLKRGALPFEEAIAIARQIAEALEEAHEKGIVHRDLKPANVKLTPGGNVKVLDFGLAKAWTGEGAGATSSANVSHSPTMTRQGTEAGMILGSAAYMSPEQARGRVVDKRADIWAFGVVLFEMLTGKRLFDGETVTDVLAAVVRQDIPWDALPAATPASVSRLLRRCLDRDPRNRLRDIGEARVAFGSPESMAGPSGLQPGGGTDASAPGLRFRAVRELAAWVVAGLALIAAGMLALRGGGSPPGEARGYRFTVPLPDLDDDLRRATISPDGRYLTYVAQGRLWLRSLENADPVAFDGTSGASEPFWSPDSRQVAFFSAGSAGSTLKKIEIRGSLAEKLAEVPRGRGTGTWSSNGAILVEITETGADHGGWYLLRPGATTMTRIRAFPKERPDSPDKAFPHFLPDGVHFLFTQPVGGEAFLQVGSTDSEETRALVRADSRAAYAEPGFVLYLRDGALIAQPFDAQTLRINGEPRRISDDVAFFAPTGRAVFSVSQQGTLVLGHRQRPSRLAWLDRDGRETGTLLGPDLYDKVKLSPDGRRLAVSINDPRTGASDIWLVDLERGVPSRLTSSPRGEFEARWSPDGRSLAFAADWQGPPNIYLQDLEGGSPRVLVPFDRKQQYPWAWTPDGRQLVYTVKDEVAKDDLWITDRAGQERRPLLATSFEETQAALSPDGRVLAFASDVTGALEIYLQSFPDGESRVRISTGGGFAPRWRGDGRELFYLTRSGQVMAVPLAAGGSPTATVAQPRPLFHFNEDALRDYDVTSDGKRFLFSLAGPGAADEVVVGWTRLLGGGRRDHERGR